MEAALNTSPNETRSVFFILVPNFSLIAFATALEPLRLTNRVLGRDYYRWTIVSPDGAPVQASNGLSSNPDCGLDAISGPGREPEQGSLVFVCSGVKVMDVVEPKLTALLRRLHGGGVTIGGLCTAAWILAKANLLEGRRCAIHWENLAGFAETFPMAEPSQDLFEIEDEIYTCAGGTSALDMMLHIIQRDHGEKTVTRVCDLALTDKMRDPTDRQRLPLRARLGIHNTKLLSMIELMEANIPEPLTLAEISSYSGLSRRHIERLFRQNLGRSPARYYLEIRLDRARHLLLQSDLPIVEVAVACGFVSASHFSKVYRAHYGVAPQADRIAVAHEAPPF